MPIIPTPPNATELVQERTLRAKVFDLGDGRRRIIQKIGKVHYVADDGTLQDIELETELDAAGDIVANKLPYLFRVHRRGIGLDYRSRADGGLVSVRLDRIGSQYLNPCTVCSPICQGNRVIFQDVADGLDIAFELARFGVRTFRILKHQQAAKSWRWEVEHDALGEARVRKDTLVGHDAQERRVNALVSNTQPEPIGNGRQRYYSTELWNDEVEVRDKTTRIASWRREAVYPVAIDPDITESIVADADDGHEKSVTGWASATTRDSFGKYNYYYDPAWRFITVPVPAGATIDLANLKVNARANFISGGGGTLFGYDTDDAAALSSSIKPSTMARTTATVTIAQSTSTGIRTYDVTTVVAEITARGGWVSNNDLTIFMDGNVGSYNVTRFEDYSDAGTDEAQLEIDYTAAASGNRRRRSIICGA